LAGDARLRPRRVITSEGGVITATAGAEVPPGVLVGCAASAGTVEGRARVVLSLEGSKLEKGEILVAPYTDPAWTPLFPLAAGLVTEGGGLITPRALVAPGYRVPAGRPGRPRDRPDPGRLPGPRQRHRGIRRAPARRRLSRAAGVMPRRARGKWRFRVLVRYPRPSPCCRGG